MWCLKEEKEEPLTTLNGSEFHKNVAFMKNENLNTLIFVNN